MTVSFLSNKSLELFNWRETEVMLLSVVRINMQGRQCATSVTNEGCEELNTYA